MSNRTVAIVLLVVFLAAAGLNVYVATALRARAPGLARRGYFSAAAFAAGALSIAARAAGLTVVWLACLAAMIVLLVIGLFQKGAFPKS